MVSMTVISETIKVRVCDEEGCDQKQANPCSNCDTDCCSDHCIQLGLNQFFENYSGKFQAILYICRKCLYIERSLDLLGLIDKELENRGWKSGNWKKVMWKNDPYVKLTGVEVEDESG